MCLAHGHNTVTSIRLEPAASRSRVKHSITEPLRHMYLVVSNVPGHMPMLEMFVDALCPTQFSVMSG